MMSFLRIVVIFLAFSFHSISVFAYNWFPSGAFCHTNGRAARCDVNNSSYYAIYCTGSITAVTFHGYYLYGGMNLWIPHGGTGFSPPLYTPYPFRDPIVSVWHDIWCQF